MIRLSPALLILVLSGCAATNANVSGEWDCPAQQGRACTTIEEADKLSSRSTISPATVSVATIAPAALLAPVSLLPETGAASATGMTEAVAPSTGEDIFPVREVRIRQAEILGRVWFYPFVDNTDHYHEGGFVHVVLRPSDWQTSPDHMFPNLDNSRGAVE